MCSLKVCFKPLSLLWKFISEADSLLRVTISPLAWLYNLSPQILAVHRKMEPAWPQKQAKGYRTGYMKIQLA